MATCSDEISCDDAKMGVESLFKKLLRKVGDCFHLSVSGTVSATMSAPANSAVTEEYFTGADNAATITALQAWKTTPGNETKKIIETVPMTGNDGANGIMIRWMA